MATAGAGAEEDLESAIWRGIELAARQRDGRRVRALLDVLEPPNARVLELRKARS